MLDRTVLYDMLYALAARDGREAALFGDCAQAARGAFLRSLVGDSFSELWFELPLTGAPWLDFHALTSYGDVASTNAEFSGLRGVYADAPVWFAKQRPQTVRQLALSYDTHLGDVESPAARRSKIGRLAHWVCVRGLADKRCGLLADTVFAKRASRGGESAMLSCFPTFVKLRWRAGEGADAKAYLLARVEEVGPHD